MSSSLRARRSALIAAAIVPLAIVAVASARPRPLPRWACAQRLTAVIRADAAVVDAPNATIQARVAGADTTLPAIAGRVETGRDSTRFQPAYAFLPGQSYRVRATVGGCSVALDTTFTLHRATSAGRTRVIAVYPTATVLPMNQLKLYVHFSAPMRAGEAAAHARIVDDVTGRTIPDAFYSLDDELWDRSQTRLTLLFDPGRIKRGLRPNEELGLPLRAGHRYRLVLDQAWLDASGDTLAGGFEKRFDVVAPDRAAPRAATWAISTPRAGSLDTLSIAFHEPLDQALLERSFLVRDLLGKPLDGRSLVPVGETRWLFVPTRAWRAGRYAVDVDTDLEDLAGNNLRRLFDTDLTDHSAPTLERGRTASISITIR